MHSEFAEKLGAVLCRRMTGCAALLSCERLSGGASQETYRLVIREDSRESSREGSRENSGDAGGERMLAMRRAPGGIAHERAAGHPGLRTEALLMQSARANGVPEPQVYLVLEPEDDLGEGFVMEWLEGEALGARIVRAESLAEVRKSLAFECGQILARIHAINLQATGLDRLLDPMTPAEFVEQTWERYRVFNTPQPMIDYTGRWLLEHLPKHPQVTLVHNDFRNGNVMVSPQGVVAVLDWEVAHVGDPMRDLGWICTNSWRFGRSDLPVGGFGEYADLFRGYESVSGKAVDPEHVRFWEVFGSFWWAVGCLGMAEHFRSGPDKTVERPGIGRRSSECQIDCVNLLMPGAVTLVPPRALESNLDMPRTDELVSSVRDYLRGDVMQATEGRLNFLARVAANSLDIVLRELSLGPDSRALELQRLRALFAGGDAAHAKLEALRWRLVHALRDGSMPLQAPGLAEHLRLTVANQVAIDQPSYSGLKTAIAQS